MGQTECMIRRIISLVCEFSGTPQLSCALIRSSQVACELVTSQATLVDQNDQSSNWNYCD
jgi:hypothetical protein